MTRKCVFAYLWAIYYIYIYISKHTTCIIWDWGERKKERKIEQKNKRWMFIWMLWTHPSIWYKLFVDDWHLKVG